MAPIAEGEWIADLEAMTCQNHINKIVVSFEKRGESIYGKVKDMPMALLSKWTAEPHGESHIAQAVLEAEEAFLKAYFENTESPSPP